MRARILLKLPKMNHSVTESTDEELSESLNDAAEDSIQQSNSSSSGVGGGGAGGSSSISNSTASTSDSSEEAGDETQIDSLELAQIGGELFRLPRGLCENANVFYEFFSLNTFNLLPQHLQDQLLQHLPCFSHLLPSAQATAEQSSTLVSLFRDGGIALERFGETPLGSLQRQLEEGNLRPDVLKLRQSIAKSQRRERRFQNCERVSHLAKELFISRERLLRNVYKSAPDTKYCTTRLLRKRGNPELGDNKMSAVRARKRYCSELKELLKELKLNIDDISTDEDDPEALTIDEQVELEKVPSDDLDDLTAMTKNANKKCIYDTFFRRQMECEDEEVIRTMQELRFTRLHEKNMKQYIRDYKRRKVSDPHLPEFDTTDIRLRDVCTRAHVPVIFKPGRRPKTKLNEPPALVPIQQQRQKDTTAVLHEESTNDGNTRYDVGDLDDDDDDNASENLNVIDVGNEIEIKQDDVMTSSQQQQHTLQQSINNELPQQVLLKTPERDRQMPKLEPIDNSQSKLKTTMMMPTITTPMVNTNLPLPLQQQQQQQQMKPPMTKLSPNASTTPPTLMLDTHACFFSLIRDLFCATPNHRMRFEELKLKLETWLANPIAALNPWFNQATNWCEVLQSAVNFLIGSFNVLPAEYVPYIEYKTQLNIYQWIGASRDSDARLSMLYSFWHQRRKDMDAINQTKIEIIPQQKQQNFMMSPNKNNNSNNSTTVNAGMTLTNTLVASTSGQLTTETLMHKQSKVDDDATNIKTVDHENIIQMQAPTPPPRCPTNWKVCAATPAEVAEFQRQERLRFERPHRAFTYHMHGYESVVGPVKGIYSQTLALTKARGHSIMIDDRPNFVTILTLVRDATARLPNGEGTRAEISELLKCSQYINPNAAENVLQTIVSGALDRMHAGHDPCVRYDPKRKIWIYLHRNRSEAEFERMHQHNQALGKQKQKSNRKPKVMGGVGGINRKEESESSIKVMHTENASVSMNKHLSPVPALVPSTLSSPIVIGSPLIKKSPQQQQQQASLLQQVSLPTKCPPVPPLKYNIPNPNVQQPQQQKSLLKSPIQMQRVSIDKVQAQQLLTNSRLKVSPTSGGGVVASNIANIATNQTIKPYALSIQQQQQIAAAAAAANKSNLVSTSHQSINAIRNNTTTTPILVSTPTGLQTVHVAGAKTPTTQTKITATVGGKKVSLAKSVVLNQINHQKSPQQLQQQLQLQHQNQDQKQNVLISSSSGSQLIGTVAATDQQQQTPPQAKNIIRLMPTAGGGKQPVQIIGQRILAQTAVRPIQQHSPQQQVKTITAGVGGSTVTLTGKAANTTGSGSTVLKMSAQAFAALQQKQGQQIVVKPTGVASGSAVIAANQPKGQQRILVGNTAISTNKNIIFQTLSGQKIQSPTNIVMSKNQNDGGALSPKVITNASTTTTTTTGGKIQTLSTANLTPQQQRVLIQNLKHQHQQQQQQQQFKVIPTSSQSPRQIESQTTITGGTATIVPSTRTLQGGTVQRMINLTDAKTQSPSGTGVAGGVTRIIRANNLLTTLSSSPVTTTTTTTTTASGQLASPTAVTATTGQIITLDDLLQRQGATLRVAGNVSSGGIGGAKVVSAANFIQLATSSAQNIVPSSSSSINTNSNLTNQFQVINPPRSIITLSPSTQTRLISTQSGPTVASTVNAKLATGARLVTTNATKVLGKATTVTSVAGSSTPTMNITTLQGKPLILPTMKNVIRTVSAGTTSVAGTAAGQTQQLQNVVLGGQTMKIQGSVQANAQRSPQMMTTATPMQTVIMGNQLLRLQQIPSSQQQSGQQQQRFTIATSNSPSVGSPVFINSSNSNGNNNESNAAAVTTTTTTTTSVASPTVLPKTLVLGSTGQTIRLQPATVAGNLQKNIIAGTNILGKSISNATTTTTAATSASVASTTASGSNVLFAVQGGGQILLSPAFQGGTATINLKQLHNMKVVSLPLATKTGDNKLLNSPKLVQLKSNSNNSPTTTAADVSTATTNDGSSSD